MDELKAKNMVLAVQAKRGDTVRVQSPRIVADEAENESVWKIPPEAFRENLERQKRGLRVPLAPTAGLVTENASDAPPGTAEIPRTLPIKRAEAPPVVASSGEDLPPIIDLTGHARKAVKMDPSGWVIPPGAPPPLEESAAPIGSHAAQAAARASEPVPGPQAASQDAGARASSEKGEHILYAKVLQSFRKRSREEMARATQLFLKTYPQSIHADNALYLSAILALEERDYDSAARGLERVLKEYPYGNKAVSALFAKGILHRQRRDYPKSREAFDRVRKLFPGSPESQRVSLEMRLLSKLERTGPQR